MKLYEIDQQIETLIDQETGEILDLEAFQSLQMERENKIENIGLWIKNLSAEAEAIKAEKQNLAERQSATENKIESLKNRLSEILGGEKFSTTKIEINFRKSASVETDDEFIEWAKKNAEGCLKYQEPKIDKTAIKNLIKLGNNLLYARIVEKQNIQIK